MHTMRKEFKPKLAAMHERVDDCVGKVVRVLKPSGVEVVWRSGEYVQGSE